MLRFVVALATSLLFGCTRPSVLVCESVGDGAVCVRPARELLGGHEYVALAVGFRLPDEVRFVVTNVTSGAVVAERRVRAGGEPRRATAPLTLHHAGRYRVAAHDAAEGGRGLFAEVELSLPRASVGPSDGGGPQGLAPRLPSAP